MPFLLAAFFYYHRQTYGYVFCLFFFFENWLYTATYIADARSMVLPLLTVGDPDNAEHDWNFILGHHGLLAYDTRIAGLVRLGGWLGMIAAAAWLVYRWRQTPRAAPPADA